MFHIPAHKNVTDPPCQLTNRPPEETAVYEVREPDPPPYKVEDPEQ